MRIIIVFAFLIGLACSQNVLAQTPPSDVQIEQNNCWIELPYRAEQLANCTPKTAAAYDFAFCSVAHLLSYAAAPEADKLLGDKSRGEAFKKKGIAYGHISTTLTDTTTFNQTIEFAKNYYKSMSGKSADEVSARLSYIRLKCDRVEVTHAEVLMELTKKLERQPSNPAQPSDRVKLVAFCTLHATSLELAYLALLAGRTDNAEVQIKEANGYFPRLEMITVEQLSKDIAVKAPKIPADVTVMGSKKFSRCLSNTGFPIETEHSAACYIFSRFVQGFYKTNGVGKAPSSAQDSEPQSAVPLGQEERSTTATPSPALLELQETVRCLGLPDKVMP